MGLTMAATLLALRLRKSVIRLESHTAWRLAPDT
jgi:hypothetical protein